MCIKRQKLWNRLNCRWCQRDRAAFILTPLLPTGVREMLVICFPAPLNRCIIYEVKYPENLVETLVGCWDMETGESFANYFPVYGRVLSITPPLTEKVEVDYWYNMSVIYEASETGRQHKSCWRSSILPNGLDGEPHQHSSALSNHLNAWSLSFMKMLKHTVHHGDSTRFQSLFLLHMFQLNFMWLPLNLWPLLTQQHSWIIFMFSGNDISS